MAVADATLVQKTLAGDIEGFGELHRRYYQKVVNVVLGIVKDRVRAEDMAQDAYMSALKELPRLVDPNRFYPWLCRIAVNRAIEDVRKKVRRSRYSVNWNDNVEQRAASSVGRICANFIRLAKRSVSPMAARVRAAALAGPVSGKLGCLTAPSTGGSSMKTGCKPRKKHFQAHSARSTSVAATWSVSTSTTFLPSATGGLVL